MDAYSMPVAGNADETPAVTAMCQTRYSELIALIRMCVRCVVVMLELMGMIGVGAYQMVVARNVGDGSMMTAMCQTGPSESIAPIRESVGYVIVVLEPMGGIGVGAYQMGVANNVGDRSTMTAMCPTGPPESIAPIRKSVGCVVVMLKLMRVIVVDAY